MRSSRARTDRRARTVAAWIVAGLLLTAGSSEPEQQPKQGLGRSIYYDGGVTAGREITALLGEAGTEIPAAALPCVGCHGESGRGGQEGGISPSDITWAALTKPYAVKRPGGRQHPPYDDTLLRRAITMGLDAGGNRLHVAMPRYRLTHDEADALVTYLRSLGDVGDPGIGVESVRVGIVQPPAGRFPAFNETVRATLEAYAAQVNEEGGIYSRLLELAFLEAPEEPTARARALDRFISERQVFALAAAYLAGAEPEIEALIRHRRVPLVGPFTHYPETGLPLNRFIFYLHAGLHEQGRSLVDFAAASLDPKAGPVAVVHPDDPALSRVAEEIVRQGLKYDGATAWAAIEQRAFPAGLFDARALSLDLRQAGTTVVLFLGTEAQTSELLHEAALLDWRPHFLLLGSLASRAAALSAGGGGRVFVAYPTLPADRTPEALAGYRELAIRHGLPSRSTGNQLAALAAAKVLVEALELAGRDLTRERVVAALEGLFEHETGLLPPLTFGPNRRIGSLGSHIVTLASEDLNRSSARWVTPR